MLFLCGNQPAYYFVGQVALCATSAFQYTPEKKKSSFIFTNTFKDLFVTCIFSGFSQVMSVCSFTMDDKATAASNIMGLWSVIDLDSTLIFNQGFKILFNLPVMQSFCLQLYCENLQSVPVPWLVLQTFLQDLLPD